MPSARALLRAVLPQSLINRFVDWRADQFKRRMSGKSSEEIFTEIYERGIWGESRAGQRFYSGSGSHDPSITEPYVQAVEAFLESLPEKPDVVDLGCGDFAIGSRIREKCAGYVACDIVASLVEHHRATFADLNVTFKVVNIAKDELPAGDVAFIRQVLQHMSNAEIAAAIPKLRATYRYLVVTEHVPGVDFVANADKAPGADIRTVNGSGVVLTEPPFSLAPVEEQLLCEATEHGARIRTHLYRLK
jgi:hypothetical protein